ncbi:MAG: DUF4342 domain-containing protein [Ardenticatenaceae bacterium]
MSTEANTTEVHEVRGNRLIGTIKSIFAAGKVNRLVISSADGNKLLNIPLAAGLTVTTLVTFLMPVLALFTPIGLLLGRFTIEVVRPEA